MEDAEGTRSYSDVQTDIESYYTISSDDDDDWEDAPEVNTSASVGNDTSVDLHPLMAGLQERSAETTKKVSTKNDTRKARPLLKSKKIHHTWMIF